MKIRMLKTVRVDYPLCYLHPDMVLWEGEVYDARRSMSGAVSAMCENGAMLGVKPTEFEIVRAEEKMKETVETRAVKIAAKVMQAAGLCRCDTPMNCPRLHTDPKTCDDCIRRWLLSKAKRELEREDKAK